MNRAFNALKTSDLYNTFTASFLPRHVFGAAINHLVELGQLVTKVRSGVGRPKKVQPAATRAKNK
jgi:hypothetical protein